MTVQDDAGGALPAETHEVFNQAEPLEPFHAWLGDVALREAVAREGGGWAEAALTAYGAAAGGPLFAAGFLAERYPPQFHSHDRQGRRINLVEYHPAYHELMRAAIEAGLPSLPWREARAGAHVARAALEYMHNQADSGSGCPLTMTFAAIPALRLQPDVGEDWIRRATKRTTGLTTTLKTHMGEFNAAYNQTRSGADYAYGGVFFDGSVKSYGVWRSFTPAPLPFRLTP